MTERSVSRQRRFKPRTVIETSEVTSLTVAGNSTSLTGAAVAGPSLKYNGADVTVGQFGGWTPIGAEQTASGYEVAWKMTGADQYTVWNTDSSGNYSQTHRRRVGDEQRTGRA